MPDERTTWDETIAATEEAETSPRQAATGTEDGSPENEAAIAALNALLVDWHYHEHCGVVCIQHHNGATDCGASGDPSSECPPLNTEWDCTQIDVTGPDRFACVHLKSESLLNVGAEDDVTGLDTTHSHHSPHKRTKRAFKALTDLLKEKGRKAKNRPAEPEE